MLLFLSFFPRAHATWYVHVSGHASRVAPQRCRRTCVCLCPLAGGGLRSPSAVLPSRGWSRCVCCCRRRSCCWRRRRNQACVHLFVFHFTFRVTFRAVVIGKPHLGKSRGHRRWGRGEQVPPARSGRVAHRHKKRQRAIFSAEGEERQKCQMNAFVSRMQAAPRPSSEGAFCPLEICFQAH